MFGGICVCVCVCVCVLVCLCMQFSLPKYNFVQPKVFKRQLPPDERPIREGAVGFWLRH